MKRILSSSMQSTDLSVSDLLSHIDSDLKIFLTDSTKNVGFDQYEDKWDVPDSLADVTIVDWFVTSNRVKIALKISYAKFEELTLQ